MLALACAAPAIAAATAIPGASYAGTTSKGGSIQFTISSDGTIVNSYQVFGLHGTYPNGNGCALEAGGAAGVWEGAAIVDNSFQYSLGTNNLWQGTFPGAQSASGTIRLFIPGSPSGACDSGTLTWTATTAATPPGGGGGGGGTPPGGGGGGGTPPGGGHKPTKKSPTYATRLELRRLSRTKLAGRISSSDRMCRADRKVLVWIGAKRAGSTRSKSNGTFSFARTNSMRGQHVRVSVSAQKLRDGLCGAGTSKFIGA